MPKALKPYDLVIATATYFGAYGHVADAQYRRGLWEGYIKSLNDTRFKQIDPFLYVSDDGSPARPDMSRFVIPRFADFHEPKTWNDNIVLMLNKVESYAPLCLIADSDSYFHPEWCSWLFKAIDNYPDAAGWSLYNTPRMADRYVRHLEDGIIEKNHSPSFGLVYRTDDRTQTDPIEWLESFIGTLAEKHSMGFVVPEISMIQHAGCYGINNVPGGSQDYDPLFPLNHECGLAGYTDRSGFENVSFSKGETKWQNATP